MTSIEVPITVTLSYGDSSGMPDWKIEFYKNVDFFGTSWMEMYQYGGRVKGGRSSETIYITDIEKFKKHVHCNRKEDVINFVKREVRRKRIDQILEDAE